MVIIIPAAAAPAEESEPDWKRADYASPEEFQEMLDREEERLAEANADDTWVEPTEEYDEAEGEEPDVKELTEEDAEIEAEPTTEGRMRILRGRCEPRPSRVAEQPVEPRKLEVKVEVPAEVLAEINAITDAETLYDLMRERRGEASSKEIEAEQLEAQAKLLRTEALKFDVLAEAAADRAEAIELAWTNVNDALAAFVALGLPMPHSKDDLAEIKRLHDGFDRMASQVAELGAKLTAAEQQVEVATDAPAAAVAEARERMAKALREQLSSNWGMGVTTRAAASAICNNGKGDKDEVVERIIARITGFLS